MKRELSPIQQEIVNTDGNIIVKASAGTGKTHTLVTKIEKDIEENKSHKGIAAITFTIKAATEIRDRLPVLSDENFIGTNNSFAIEEVIKPFMKDVYGKEYDIEMGTDYEITVDEYEDGINEIKDSGIISSFVDKKKNFIFQLSLEILKNSFAAREYLKAKYFKIFIDEYQDCDKDMHAFFMYLCDDLGLDTFVVGDAKQSIYMWRGAYPQAFKSIWEKNNFTKKFMAENFRSCLAIQNYSNMLCEETRQYIKEMDDVSSVKLLCFENGDWVEEIKKELDIEKKTAVLRFSRKNAKQSAKELRNVGMDITYIPQPPIVDITTNAAWLYTAIASYFIIDTYSVYDIIQIIPDEAIGYTRLKKNLEDQLVSIGTSIENANIDDFKCRVADLASFFGYETKTTHLEKLYKTITEEDNHYFYLQDKLKNVSMTFHSSKGLEFDQVVLFAEDYKLYNEDHVYNHYVASTRAKEKLIIVYLNQEGDKAFYKSLSKIVHGLNKKVEDFMKIVLYK